jgi:membrane protein implicated in regulation of membrane protease activity
MLTSVDARRRWFGTFFLIVAGGMLLWGFTFLASFLVKRPMVFVIYWIACLGFTLLSFLIAVYDMRVIRNRVREEKRAAFNKAFSDIVDEEKK